MHVYERFRQYIESRGIKQKDLAKASGIPNVTLNAMLNGKRRMYAEDVTALCRALKEGPSKFLGLEELEEAG